MPQTFRKGAYRGLPPCQPSELSPPLTTRPRFANWMSCFDVHPKLLLKPKVSNRTSGGVSRQQGKASRFLVVWYRLSGRNDDQTGCSSVQTDFTHPPY
jgi:hypothetical protein